MGASFLFGLCVCLAVGVDFGMAVGCDQNSFSRCRLRLGEIDIPHNLNQVCSMLQMALTCVSDLWKSCGYECLEEFRKQEYSDLQCTIHDKQYSGPMNRTANPCTILTQMKKCLDYNCPNGDHFPDPMPIGYSPNLGNLVYTQQETDELLEKRKCPMYATEKYLKDYAHNNLDNILDCQHCTEIKLNWHYFQEDLGESTYGHDMCEGSTTQQLMVDIMKVGTQHYIKECDSVKCDASSISNPLVAICLLTIAYVFSS